MSDGACASRRRASLAGMLAAPALAAAALASGCAAVGLDLGAPPAGTLSTYSERDPVRADAGALEPAQRFVAATPAGDAAADWWTAFGAPALDAMVAQAFTASPTMQTAVATVAQAREAVVAARGALYPQLTLDLSASRGTPASGGSVGVADSSALGIGAAYEVDAFGAVSRRIEQAQALAQVQQAQWQAARLALAGGTVQQAITLASAIEQMRAVQDIVGADERNLELVQLSLAAGKSAGLDVLAAQSQLASDQALLPPLQQQASAARHALAILTGRAPAELPQLEFDFRVLVLPQRLPVSLPSALVRQRPDLQAAQAQLHAASAAVGIATAALYPNLTLNASWTAAAAGGSALFSGTRGIWVLAAGLLAPVFDGGTLRAQRAAAVDGYAAQLGIYRQAVLTAFGQVADALQALQNDAAALQAQRRALDTALASLDLTQQSFEAGQASFLQILVAQRLFQQARLGHVRAQAQRYADSAQLFVAMGGGTAASAAAAPSEP